MQAIRIVLNPYGRRLLTVLLLLLFSLKNYAQPLTGVNRPVAALTAYQKAMPAEKIYLQFDKPNYVTGDTVWFKGYVFNAAFLTPSMQSGLLYAQLTDESNKTIKTVRVPVNYGLASGYIVLLPEEFSGGNYMLRAYTNWMRNFGTDGVFKKELTISANGAEAWLVTSTARMVKSAAGQQQVYTRLALSNMDGRALGFSQVELTALQGKARKRVLSKATLQTRIDGSLEVNISLPDGADAGQLQLMVKGGNKQQLTIPLDVQQLDIDVQFMPEGGSSLVANLPNKIGFKAIGTDGRGKQVAGSIFNSAGQMISNFQSVHNGMGAFELLPQANEQYTARIQQENGSTKTFNLPAVKTTGTVLSIGPNWGRDSLTINLKATADLLGSKYYIIGQAHGVVCYAAEVNLNMQATAVQVVKNKFPEGIARFTLFNEQQQPLNERVVYNDRFDRLNLQVKSFKQKYAPRDSIALDIEVCDNEGKPVQGSFSLAVTDNEQVKINVENQENIITNTLLTADLKGYVENAPYYLQAGAENRAALDNLLLTQGWVGYQWANVFKAPVKPEFEAETELAVKGRVNNIMHKAVKGTRVKIMSAKPLLVSDTLTNEEGVFKFSNLPEADTVGYVLQALNKKNKDFNVGIEMSDAPPAQFEPDNLLQRPWYNNSDSVLLNQLKANRKKQEILQKMPGNQLKEVTINDVRKIKGLVGIPQLVLDEKTVVKAAKQPLLDFLYKNIPGFRKGVPRRGQGVNYMVGNTLISIIVDVGRPPGMGKKLFYFVNNDVIGFVVDDFDMMTKYFETEPPPDELTHYINWIGDFFESMTCEDIKQVALINGGIYITTRSGNGPFTKARPGFYLYKPLPVTWPKDFYRPRYAVNAPAQIPDTRATIHWEPNVVTGADGKATVAFYAADGKTTYTVLTEGSDMGGRLGVGTAQIKVE